MRIQSTFLFWVMVLLFSAYVVGQESIYILNDNIYGDITDGLPDESRGIEIRNKQGKVIGVGKVAFQKNKSTNLRVGYWKEYYQNGTIEKEGTYKLGSYVQCCYGGACAQYYYYRTGLWKFYDTDGNISHELVFEPSEIHIDTNCEGGDNLLFGIVESIPLNYLDKVSADMIFESQKVKIKTENWTDIFIPLNGKLFIELVEEN